MYIFFWRQIVNFTGKLTNRHDNTKKNRFKIIEFLTCNTLRKRTKDKSSRYDKIVDISKVKLVSKNTREFLINNQV